MPLSATLLAIGAYTLASVAYHAKTMAIANDANSQVIKPVTPVSVVVACWHENQSVMEQSLQSIRASNIFQAYPESIHLVVIGCEDVDMTIAQEYADVTDCRSGKLSARNLGVELATGDIIVSLDCDVLVPPNWVNMIIQPFKDPNVVAVQTTSIQDGMPMLATINRLGTDFFNIDKILGRGSAFRKSAFLAIGGFNESINQKDIVQMLAEEEYGFRQKLESLGKVVFLPYPVVHLRGYSTKQGLRS